MLQAAGSKVPRALQAALESSPRLATQPLDGQWLPSCQNLLPLRSCLWICHSLKFEFSVQDSINEDLKVSIQVAFSKQRLTQMGRSDESIRRHTGAILAGSGRI